MGMVQGAMAQEKEPYAVLNEDNTVLTFYYDTQKAARNGMSIGPFEYDYDSDQPTTSWYAQCATITTVVFDPSFADCTSLTCTAFWFLTCENLTTITGIENLKTDNVTDMRFMFADCPSLVGGNGTAYDAGHTDHEYARIDKEGQPGYLTQKEATRIENLTTASIQEEGTWYTLDGRRVETPVKGVYVKNGRKVVVK